MDNEQNRIIHRQEFLVRIRGHTKKDRKAMPSPNSWRSSGLEDKLQSKTWRFPKIRGTFLGIPIIRTIVFWGLYWGPLI